MENIEITLPCNIMEFVMKTVTNQQKWHYNNKSQDREYFIAVCNGNDLQHNGSDNRYHNVVTASVTPCRSSTLVKHQN